MRAAIHPRQSLKTHNRLTRVICYVLGMLILAIGLTLTAETRLGASALTAIPFCGIPPVSPISLCKCHLGPFFLIYVAVQLVVTRDRRTLVLTLLQLPLSVLFTGVMHIAQDAIEVEAFPLPARLGFLALAIVFTGIGAAMTLKMKLIPNPGDGFVQTLAEKTGKTPRYDEKILWTSSASAPLRCCPCSVWASSRVWGLGASWPCSAWDGSLRCTTILQKYSSWSHSRKKPKKARKDSIKQNIAGLISKGFSFALCLSMALALTSNIAYAASGTVVFQEFPAIEDIIAANGIDETYGPNTKEGYIKNKFLGYYQTTVQVEGENRTALLLYAGVLYHQQSGCPGSSGRGR